MAALCLLVGTLCLGVICDPRLAERYSATEFRSNSISQYGYLEILDSAGLVVKVNAWGSPRDPGSYVTDVQIRNRSKKSAALEIGDAGISLGGVELSTKLLSLHWADGEGSITGTVIAIPRGAEVFVRLLSSDTILTDYVDEFWVRPGQITLDNGVAITLDSVRFKHGTP